MISQGGLKMVTTSEIRFTARELAEAINNKKDLCPFVEHATVLYTQVQDIERDILINYDMFTKKYNTPEHITGIDSLVQKAGKCGALIFDIKKFAQNKESNKMRDPMQSLFLNYSQIVEIASTLWMTNRRLESEANWMKNTGR